MRTLAVLLLLGLSISGPPGALAQTAALPVQLLEWEDVAALHSGGEAGRDTFELTAVARWSPNASGPYALRVVLPQGTVETQPIRATDDPRPRRLTVFVPAASVQNLRPSSVVVRVSVVDTALNAEVSNALSARIGNFPHPGSDEPAEPMMPFGWGRPLSRTARALPRPGPDDFHYIRVTDDPRGAAVFLATAEASNAQVARRLAGYDPRAGRSDEFLLEDPRQPALGLSAKKAASYLAALSKADPTGVVYRLPTAAQWLGAARCGGASGFFWGDESARTASTNYLGPEPALATDTTAPARPQPGALAFLANPWGLFHSFGNVAEWGTTPTGGFVRLGGHFRSEPSAPVEVSVVDAASTGPDAYVGVRPAFVLDAATGTTLARRALTANPRLRSLHVSVDPYRATATLQGALPDAALRHEADRRLAAVWFLAAVDNKVETPKFLPGQLARIGSVAGPARRITPLGRWHYEVPVEVRWNSPLPVTGTEWWVNLYLPGGRHAAHRMAEREPGESQRLTVVIDNAQMSAAGLAVDAPISVALSLGGQAQNPGDPRVVSNVAILHWKRP